MRNLLFMNKIIKVFSKISTYKNSKKSIMLMLHVVCCNNKVTKVKVEENYISFQDI